MLKLAAHLLDLRQLDELAAQQTFIHRLTGSAKVLTTIVFVLAVTSFSKYELSGLMPFFLYPVILTGLGNLPYSSILKRLLAAAPFIAGIGLFNPLLDQAPFAALGPVIISGGWISFLSIALKLALTVSAALLLVATTGLNAIGLALLQLGAPKPLVVQLLFMYRYLQVLIEESYRLTLAYQLRAPARKGIHYQAWGSLPGQLLLRTVERAKRIYQAMLCRGFDGEIRLLHTGSWQRRDTLYLAGWSSFFILCRFANIPQTLGRLLLEVLK